LSAGDAKSEAEIEETEIRAEDERVDARNPCAECHADTDLTLELAHREA
jgi:hypothetical protein